jgi:hypothetical protein
VKESTKRSSVDCLAPPADGPREDGAAGGAEGAGADGWYAEGWRGGPWKEGAGAVEVEDEATAQALSISRTAASQSKPCG